MATEAAIARFELPVEFSAAALREAAHWGKSVDAAEAAQRVDLRALPLVTIDGEDARDFDDAVYAERLDAAAFRLLVAIADVSHYVRPGTALDSEARARGTSVYFPTRVMPMLPTALSNHLCSLEPHVDRLCMVADMRVTERGALQGRRFYPAVMRSAARLTYTRRRTRRCSSARRPRGAQLGRPASSGCCRWWRSTACYRRRARRRGALDFDAPEAEFVLDAASACAPSNSVSRNDAHRLIEECMILANVAVAQELRAAAVPALYRVQPRPMSRSSISCAPPCACSASSCRCPSRCKPRDLAAIAARLRDPQSRPFVESLVVRSMAQALYQPDNIGHFGLALERLRALHLADPALSGSDDSSRAARALGLLRRIAAPQRAQTLTPQGSELSRLERRADEADRYVATFLKCVYLRERIGQTFDGLITTVIEFGCFVQLLAWASTGCCRWTSCATMTT